MELSLVEIKPSPNENRHSKNKGYEGQDKWPVVKASWISITIQT